MIMSLPSFDTLDCNVGYNGNDHDQGCNHEEHGETGDVRIDLRTAVNTVRALVKIRLERYGEILLRAESLP